MEVQNIGLFAIYNVPQTVSAPITWLFFIALKNGVHHHKAQRMSFRMIYYMASFDELTNWPHLLIGGASTASEATLSSSPLRFAVYVGIIVRATKSLRR